FPPVSHFSPFLEIGWDEKRGIFPKRGKMGENFPIFLFLLSISYKLFPTFPTFPPKNRTPKKNTTKKNKEEVLYSISSSKEFLGF
ncbi:TPA: hypothetical protein ACUMYW_001224, partial [Haemophilus influenzae]